jgi:hypothetical protein
MEMNNQGGEKMCNCPHHKFFPFAVLVVGVLFLLQALGVALGNWFNIVWPILLILWALKKMSKGSCKCCDKK